MQLVSIATPQSKILVTIYHNLPDNIKDLKLTRETEPHSSACGKLSIQIFSQSMHWTYREENLTHIPVGDTNV